MNNKSNGGGVKSNENSRVSKGPKSDGYEVKECTVKISVIEKDHEKQELMGVKREKVKDHKFMDNKFSTDIPKEKRVKITSLAQLHRHGLVQLAPQLLTLHSSLLLQGSLVIWL
ncbi:hypothetical protein V6N13_015143 [Hibiscus sabdariffa]